MIFLIVLLTFQWFLACALDRPMKPLSAWALLPLIGIMVIVDHVIEDGAKEMRFVTPKRVPTDLTKLRFQQWNLYLFGRLTGAIAAQEMPSGHGAYVEWGKCPHKPRYVVYYATFEEAYERALRRKRSCYC